MKTNKKSPWKSGYGPLLGLFGFAGFLLAIGFLAFSLHDPKDQTAIIFLALGLALFSVCAIFGVANWLIEKHVNQELTFRELTQPFEAFFVPRDDATDPLVWLERDGKHISRNFDQAYKVNLIPVALGVSIYIFTNKYDKKENFCVVYNQYGLADHHFKAFEISA